MEKVLELDPGNAKAYTYLGEILLWQGNAAAAKKYLPAMAEIDPRRPGGDRLGD